MYRKNFRYLSKKEWAYKYEITNVYIIKYILINVDPIHV